MPEYDFLREQIAKFAAGYVRGDTVTGVQAMLKVVELPEPPLRLAIGPNALQTLIQKLSSDIEEYKRFEHIWQDSTANVSASSNLSHLSQQV
jgi:hypothetical protein